MKYWMELLVDARSIQTIYGENVPTLDGIDLHEVVLKRDGPSVLVRFDLNCFPMHPPKKWEMGCFNRVQLTLLGLGVRELTIKGLQTECSLDLHVAEEGAGVRLFADNGRVSIDILTDRLLIDRISAYCDQSRRNRGINSLE